jgi:hypothetical protein
MRSEATAALNSSTFSSTNAFGERPSSFPHLDVHRVLVGPGEEARVVADHPVPTGDGVGADHLVERMDAGLAVGVGDRGRQVEARARVVGHVDLGEWAREARRGPARGRVWRPTLGLAVVWSDLPRAGPPGHRHPAPESIHAAMIGEARGGGQAWAVGSASRGGSSGATVP